MKRTRSFTAFAVALLATTTLTISSAASQDQGFTNGSAVVGIGGAGAFIPPAHVNGPFGAGGPLAGLGGAGAFIPTAQ